jgi:hypothetical protein
MKITAKKMTEILEQHIDISESGSFSIMDFDGKVSNRDDPNYLVEFDSPATAKSAKDMLTKAGFSSSINKPNELKVYQKNVTRLSDGDDGPAISKCLKNNGLREN